MNEVSATALTLSASDTESDIVASLRNSSITARFLLSKTELTVGTGTYVTDVPPPKSMLPRSGVWEIRGLNTAACKSLETLGSAPRKIFSISMDFASIFGAVQSSG